MLHLRITHVKPGAPTKVWDAKMVDGRRDVRVFPNGQQGDSSEFIEINVLDNTDGSNISSLFPAQLLGEPAKKLSKSQRKKIARKKAK